MYLCAQMLRRSERQRMWLKNGHVKWSEEGKRQETFSAPPFSFPHSFSPSFPSFQHPFFLLSLPPTCLHHKTKERACQLKHSFPRSLRIPYPVHSPLPKERKTLETSIEKKWLVFNRWWYMHCKPHSCPVTSAQDTPDWTRNRHVA